MAPAELESRLASMLSRRSVGTYADEGPSDEELDAILRAAVTVPDHAGLRPWRLVVVRGDARAAFGDALAQAGRAADPELTPEGAERLRTKAFVAPALIAVVAHLRPNPKVPEWEQVASAACLGYAIALAAHQLGLGAMWKSSPHRSGEALERVLDMEPSDRFLGWVNLGRLPGGPLGGPRPPVDLADIVRELTPAGEPRGRADGQAQTSS